MKQKIIKTNYKVAVVANQIEKRIRKVVGTYTSSNYQVKAEKVCTGTRYIYILPEHSYSSITHFVARDIFEVVRPYQDEYSTGSICCGIEKIMHQGEEFPAVFIMVTKSNPN